MMSTLSASAGATLHGAGTSANSAAASTMTAGAPARKPRVPPHFSVGDQVRVRIAFPPGHVRTPFYCRGKTGVIERLCGAFANPEELAYNRDGLPPQPLYRVRFTSRELWGEGASQDVIEIEIYQHWLEAVDGVDAGEQAS